MGLVKFSIIGIVKGEMETLVNDRSIRISDFEEITESLRKGHEITLRVEGGNNDLIDSIDPLLNKKLFE